MTTGVPSSFLTVIAALAIGNWIGSLKVTLSVVGGEILVAPLMGLVETRTGEVRSSAAVVNDQAPFSGIPAKALPDRSVIAPLGMTTL